MFRTAAITIAISLAAANAAAGEIEVRFADDPVRGNARPDDLYTADLRIDLRFGDRHVSLGEKMFTDRERGFRFDETHLSVGRELELGAWRGEGSFGVVRIGRGLLGQSAQNEVHAAINSTELDLDYAAKEDVFPTIEATLERPVANFRTTRVKAVTSAYSAPGFRSWARGGFVAEHPFTRTLTLSIGAGARVEANDYEFLRDHISPIAPTAEVSIAWRSAVVRWSHNEYGTSSPHLSIGFRSAF